ncbi:MAG: hypothetical protein J6P79_14945 [Pseudobutyrivibrio sp.]|nr:hypothetical protein [Pseudobutyrivibrio sp.]
MKLVNCPVCGFRCSLETAKCPECNFDIKDYFNNQSERHFSFKKKYLIIPITITIIAISGFLISKTIMSKVSPELDKTPIVSSDSAKTSSTATENTDSSITQEEEVIGVYSGDDHEILVINDNHLAYYYCAEKSYTELECPWYIDNNKIYIEFSRLHCTVSASSSNTSDLILKAEPSNLNWNSEVFTKLDVLPDEYLDRTVTPYDANATQNSDGTMTILFDGISYIIPKEYIDLEDEYDSNKNCSMFVSIDAQNDYVGTLLFYSEPKLVETEANDKALVSSFASNFLDNSTVSEYQGIQVNGLEANIFSVNGNLNKGFSSNEGTNYSGFIVSINNISNNSIDFIMLIENNNRSNSKHEELLELIDTAQ